MVVCVSQVKFFNKYCRFVVDVHEQLRYFYLKHGYALVQGSHIHTSYLVSSLCNHYNALRLQLETS